MSPIPFACTYNPDALIVVASVPPGAKFANGVVPSEITCTIWRINGSSINAVIIPWSVGKLTYVFDVSPFDLSQLAFFTVRITNGSASITTDNQFADLVTFRS